MTAERFPDKTATPPGYYDKPEYLCPICGPVYIDETTDDLICIICGEYVGDDSKGDE